MRLVVVAALVASVAAVPSSGTPMWQEWIRQAEERRAANGDATTDAAGSSEAPSPTTVGVPDAELHGSSQGAAPLEVAADRSSWPVEPRAFCGSTDDHPAG